MNGKEVVKTFIGLTVWGSVVAGFWLYSFRLISWHLPFLALVGMFFVGVMFAEGRPR